MRLNPLIYFVTLPKYIRKRCVTLLELLLVMAILSITASVVTINIRGMMSHQRFYSAIEIITDKLQMAQNIMLIFNSDTTVTIEKKEGSTDTFLFQMESEAPLPPAMEALMKKNKDIIGIHNIRFDNESNDPIKLKFSAINHITPTGILEFSTSDDTSKEYITLMGYPHSIEAKPTPQVIEEAQNESALLYPKEVRAQWQLNQEG